VGKLKRADPRAVEDAKLQAAAEKLVEAKERAMISLEKAEQKHLQAMQTWSKGLETGTANSSSSGVVPWCGRLSKYFYLAESDDVNRWSSYLGIACIWS